MLGERIIVSLAMVVGWFRRERKTKRRRYQPYGVCRYCSDDAMDYRVRAYSKEKVPLCFRAKCLFKEMSNDVPEELPSKDYIVDPYQPPDSAVILSRNASQLVAHTFLNVGYWLLKTVEHPSGMVEYVFRLPAPIESSDGTWSDTVHVWLRVETDADLG